MERITEKYDINYKHKDISKIELDEMYSCLKDRNLLAQTFWKLGQLEDIEEELGIDLIILFKALKNGVYYFVNGTQLTKDYVWLTDNYMSIGTRDKLSYSFMTAFERRTLLFNDYGKTWALTKEELE